MSRRHVIFMGALAATWGASYLFIKIGLRDFSSGFVVFGRTALAAGVLLLIARRMGALAGLRAVRGPIVLLAVVQVAIPFVLITEGEHRIPSGLTGILVASAPIFMALLALRFDHAERASGWAAVGIITGIVGVVVLFGFDLHGDTDALVGGGMVLVASLGYAIGPLYMKRRLSTVQPAGIAAATMAVSAILMLPLAVISPPDSAGADAIGALLALGILGTGVAFLLFYSLIAEIGPARASIVAYLAPVFAVIYGVALLDEPVTIATLAGLVLILAGSYLGAVGRPPGALSRIGPFRSSVPAPARVR